MNAEQFFNNGFGADVDKVHRKHVIELMTNFAKHYYTEQFNIARVVGRSEQLPCPECSGNGGGVTDNGWEQCDCQK